MIAALVGAHAVLDARDRERVRGFIINKFRGEVELFRAGIDTIEAHTDGVRSVSCRGCTLPERCRRKMRWRWSMGPAGSTARVHVAIPHLPHIANFDDFDPLRFEPDVHLEFIAPGRPLPLDADLIILPGSKATIADLEFLRAQGWHIDLQAHVRRGGRVLGVCAGYQMLGKRVEDPQRIEGSQESCSGLDLLDVNSTMTAKTRPAARCRHRADERRTNRRLRNAPGRDERTRRITTDDPLRRRQVRWRGVGGRPHRRLPCARIIR